MKPVFSMKRSCAALVLAFWAFSICPAAMAQSCSYNVDKDEKSLSQVRAALVQLRQIASSQQDNSRIDSLQSEETALRNELGSWIQKAKVVQSQVCESYERDLATYNEEVAAHNSRCEGTIHDPDVYRECQESYRRLAQEKADLDQRRLDLHSQQAELNKWGADLLSREQAAAERAQELLTMVNCEHRASAVSQWTASKERVSEDRQVIRNLYANFEEQAANVNAWGEDLSRVKEYEEHMHELIEDLGKAGGIARRVPSTEGAMELISESELKEYEVIAQGMVSWTTNIIKLVAAHEINKRTEAVAAGLKDLQAREIRLETDVSDLTQANQRLSSFGACDSTKLVK